MNQTQNQDTTMWDVYKRQNQNIVFIDNNYYYKKDVITRPTLNNLGTNDFLEASQQVIITSHPYYYKKDVITRSTLNNLGTKDFQEPRQPVIITTHPY